MRIALVTEWIDGWRGGAETSTFQFLHHLLEAGVEVDLFTRSRISPVPGLQVHTVSGAAVTRTRRSITFAHRVDRRVRDGAYDVVHAITPCRSATVYQPRGGTVAESVERNLALLPPGRLRGLKRIANRLNFKQRHQLALERRLFTSPDGPVILALSNYVADQLRRHYGVDASRVRVVYNAVNPDETSASRRRQDRAAIRSEYAIADTDFLVIAVAHNFRLKGVARWLEAQALLRREDGRRVRSLIIGRMPSARWRQQAARLGVSDAVRFVGPSNRVGAFMHAADVLVHPTYYDPCSRVVLEALVSGLPCVTTRWDGASEAICHGENGFVVDDPADVAGIAACVRRLLDPSVQEAAGRATLAGAERLYMKRHAREVIGVYKEMTARSVR
ncbi:MAG: D-inositol-3-phosphate glycosyltransferase [Phycisphaerae bacterium]|nr:D-inositol-3-phosphate glycosyltransferase [Phycisphaerae bacterium]